jgi:hypothetical protein
MKQGVQIAACGSMSPFRAALLTCKSITYPVNYEGSGSPTCKNELINITLDYQQTSHDHAMQFIYQLKQGK